MKKYYVLNVKGSNNHLDGVYFQLENRKSNQYIYLAREDFINDKNIEERKNLHLKFSRKNMIYNGLNGNVVSKAFETEQEALDFIELKEINMKLRSALTNKHVYDDTMICNDIELVKQFLVHLQTKQN